MFLLESAGIGVGLSMDAFAITLANMMAYAAYLRGGRKWLMPLFFALFQGIMPLLGAVLGTALERVVAQYGRWVLFVVLGVIGGKMLWDALRGGGEEAPSDSEKGCSVGLIAFQAVATSIDAFAVGVGYAASGQNALAAAPVIALTTFAICAFAALLGGKVGRALGDKATIFGGLILILIGVLSLIR